MTLDEFRDHMRRCAGEHGGIRAMAEGCGVSETFIRDVIAGRRVPSKKILDGLGFEKTLAVSYDQKRVQI